MKRFLCVFGFAGMVLAPPVFGDEASVRDARAEKALAELYGEGVGDWAGRDKAVQPKKAAMATPGKVPVKTVEPQRKPAEATITEAPAVQERVLSDVPVEKNVTPAAKPVTRSAKTPAAGKSGTGLVVYDKDGRVNDFKTVASFTQAAKKGDATAQFNLGLAYEHGWGVRENLPEAALWYAKAAEQGHAAAQLNLGLMYYVGRGVQQDAKHGFLLFQKSAGQGNATAQFNMGNVYLKGEGVAASDATAVSWFRKAAEQGLVMAQYSLARMYVDGAGVKQDLAEAVMWYEKAAAQGYRDAQAALGLAYEKGYGVSADRAEAVKWYEKAAAQGHEGAAQHLSALKKGL